MRVLSVLGAALVMGGAAHADVLDISLNGWQAEGAYLNPGNTNATVNLPIGTTIDHAEYIDLTYTSPDPSWPSELTLSLNDSDQAVSFWDTTIAGAPDESGTYGPVSSDFADPGVFGSGPFTLTTGELYIEVYDLFDDSGIDQTISDGILRIHYTVPAPGTAVLLGVFLLGRRRR